MESSVLVPLSLLQGMFTGPQKLIQKRYDKLLDYCSRLERSSSFSSSSSPSTPAASPSQVTDDTSGPARRDYEALNAMLVEELQRFNVAAFTILTNSVVNIVALLRRLMDMILLGSPNIHQLPVSSETQPESLRTSRQFIGLILELKHVSLSRLRCQTLPRCRTASWRSSTI